MALLPNTCMCSTVRLKEVIRPVSRRSSIASVGSAAGESSPITAVMAAAAAAVRRRRSSLVLLRRVDSIGDNDDCSLSPGCTLLPDSVNPTPHPYCKQISRIFTCSSKSPFILNILLLVRKAQSLPLALPTGLAGIFHCLEISGKLTVATHSPSIVMS